MKTIDEGYLFGIDADTLRIKMRERVANTNYSSEFTRISNSCNDDTWLEIESYATLQNDWYVNKTDTEDMIDIAVDVQIFLNTLNTLVPSDSQSNNIEEWAKLIIVNLYKLIHISRFINNKYLSEDEYNKLSIEERTNYFKSVNLYHVSKIINNVAISCSKAMQFYYSKLSTEILLDTLHANFIDCDKVGNEHSIYTHKCPDISENSKITNIDYNPQSNRFLKLEINDANAQLLGLLIKTHGSDKIDGIIISSRSSGTGDSTSYYVMHDKIQIELLYNGEKVTNAEFNGMSVLDVAFITNKSVVMYNGKFAEFYEISHKYILNEGNLLETKISFIGKHCFTN